MAQPQHPKPYEPYAKTETHTNPNHQLVCQNSNHTPENKPKTTNTSQKHKTVQVRSGNTLPIKTRKERTDKTKLIKHAPKNGHLTYNRRRSTSLTVWSDPFERITVARERVGTMCLRRFGKFTACHTSRPAASISSVERFANFRK